MKRSRARLAAIVCAALGVCGGLGYFMTRPPTSDGAGADARADAGPPKARPAGAAERALVSPLTEGSALGDFEVVAIYAVNEEGALRVVCARDRAVVRLDVGLATEDGPAPPALAGHYAVFYSIKNATPEEGERLAAELAKIVQANAGAEAPPGMAPYKPGPRQLPPI